MSGFIVEPVATSVSYAVGGTVTTDFPVTFPFDEPGDLRVYVNGELETGWTLTATTVEENFYTAATVVLASGVTNATVVLARLTAIEQMAKFPNAGRFSVATLNAEIARLWMAQQDRERGLEQAVRGQEGETFARLAGAAARVNKLLIFDESGNPTLGDIPGAGTSLTGDASLATALAAGGTTARTLASRAADEINILDHGASTALADNAAAITAAFTLAAAAGKMVFVPAGEFAISSAVALPSGARGIRMNGTFVSSGGFVALTCGSGGTTNNQAKTYGPIRVRRASLSDWSTEDDIGVRLVNCDACLCEVALAEGFTIGVQTLGDGRGFEDSTVLLGRLVDNKVGLDVRTALPGAWNNSIRYIGGHFACASGTNTSLDRFGVRLSKVSGGYDLHNAHTFIGPAFELQDTGSGEARPFLLEVGGRGLRAVGMRMENSSAFAARHTAGYQDAVYEVSYIGTYGFNIAVDYPSGATRDGGTVVPLHQAAAAIYSPKLIADAGDVRRRAYRESSTATGFEGMALLSANPVGPPTTMNGLLFPGLSLLTLNADTVTIPTSRALGFVVDTTICKGFLVAADGTELRVVVQQYDASENVLAPADNIALLSNGGMQEGVSTAQWWEGGADLDALTGGVLLNRLQRVTVPAACKRAFIGVRGGSASAAIRALRLYVGGEHFPQVLTRERAASVNGWGLRRLRGVHASWAVPDLAASAQAQLASATADQVPVVGAVPGDMVQVGYVMSAGSQNGGVVFHGSVSVAGKVSVSAQNLSAATIQLDGGGTNTVALFVEVTKPLV